METKTRLEPPDGGWGIIICIGMAISFISPTSIMSSFGLVFGDFLKGLGAETSVISVTSSIFFCSYSFAGLCSGCLFNRFSFRVVGLLGGFSYFVGSLLQIFVNSTITFLLTFSVLQGIGFGLMVPSALATFNNYFVKKRIMWLSFAQALIGVGSMIFPLLLQKLMDLYGFRGCLSVLAAINSHVVLGMLLMQPVKWHMRKVPITNENMENGYTDASVKAISLDNNASTDLKQASTNSGHEDQLSPLMYNRKSSHILSREMFPAISSRCSSITSLGNWTGAAIVATDVATEKPNETNAADKDKRSLCQIVVDFLDLTLLKQPIYVNIVLGITFALYSDITFFTLQPLYLFEIGFDAQDTASIISIGAAADLVSRIVLAFLAVFYQVPPRYLYLAGALFTILFRFVFLKCFDVISMSIITAIMGFFRTWVHVPQPLIFAEYLPKERFASGYGLFMFLKGNIIFIISPVIGYIRDSTQDYILAFHCLNFIMALCAFPWIFEIIFIKFRRNTLADANANS